MSILEEAEPREWRHPFELDLARLDKSLLDDETFLQELYAALCNTYWLRKGKSYQESEENKHILINEDGEQAYSCSWRYAGGVADDLGCYGEVRYGRNYLEYYCSGGEGQAGDRVRKALDALGWVAGEM